MKTHFNNVEYAKKMAQPQAKQLNVFPPAIMFEKHKDKEHDTDKVKDKYHSFDMKIDDENEVEFHVRVFENGTPEDHCIFLKEFQDPLAGCDGS